MRIVAGRHRGRRLAALPGPAIRPTADRIREAIFDILAHRLFAGRFAEASVLDAFAGTGAMGLEALSRHAARATFLDSDPAAVRLIAANVKHVGEQERALVLQRDATKPGRAPRMHDLAFFDPPYRSGLAVVAVPALATEGWLAPAALLVLEHAAAETLAPPAGFTTIDERRYGKTKVAFWQYGSAEE
jgi:16S rRNA (guanine966-N2)-methyltransferase